MKICPNCHKEFNDEHSFCGICGTKLEVKHVFCTKCGCEVNPNQPFCGSCGAKLSINTTASKADKIALELLSKTEKVTRLASEKTKELLSDKNVGEIKAQLTSNAEQAREKFSTVSQNIQSGELSFDLIKMFPTSDSQYNAYIKFMIMPVIISIFTVNIYFLHEMTNIIPDSIFVVSELLNVIVFLFIIYVMGYIFVKAGIIKYLGKILLGLFLTFLFCSIGAKIGPDGAGIFFFFTICFSIYKNYVRKKYIEKHLRYIIYPIGVGFVMGALTLFAYYLYSVNLISGYHYWETPSIISLMFYVTLIVTLGPIVGFFAMCRFMRKEQTKGISFLAMNRLMFTVPATAIFYCFSFLTIFHFFDLSPNDVITDGALNAESATAVDPTQPVTASTASLDHEPHFADADSHFDVVTTNEHNVTSVRFDDQNGILYDNNGRELAHLTNYHLISNEGKIIARFDPNSNLFYDGFNQPLNVTIDDISFRHIENIHENNPSGVDNIDIINGEILNVKTHAHIGFVTPNTLVHQNSIAFSNIDDTQPENVDTHSDHLVITNENGSLTTRFDSQTGILYDKDGHEIAHLINNHITTADGKTLAKYDSTSNLFYDKYMQPLDVKIDGTTFQHVKDVHGNGIDIINGEIFDAKTHKRIGSIMTIK